MNDDSGALDFATGVDTSGYDAGMQHMEETTSETVASIEQATSKIAEAINNMPEANISLDPSTYTDLDQLGEAYAEISRVVRINGGEVQELQKKYNALTAQINKFQKVPSKRDDVAKLKEERAAVTEVIKVRKQVIQAAKEQEAALTKLEPAIKKHIQDTKNDDTAQVSLRQRMRELKMELVEMEAQGLRGTEQYRATQEEVAKLTDAWGDAQAQANILANDQRGMQGLISGLSGVAGAFSAAQGAVGLFGDANEDLQKIMVKVQSLMAITMGLQQVQATLNKDSAFSLVTLNGLKEWWNKLLAVGTAEQAAETVATEANAVAAASSAAANEAEALAKEQVSGASGVAATTEGVDAAAKGTNAAAATAGTAANISLAGAFRMVGAAISSIPVFGWIAAAIGALIGVISHFVKKANATKEAVKEKNEMLKDARETYIKNSMEIQTYQQRLENFNGTAEQERKLVADLNGKYGEHLGYCKTAAEWKAKLAEKGAAYCEMMMKEAEAQAILSKVTNAYINLLEVKAKAESGEYDHWYNTKLGDEKSRQKAIDEAQAELDKWTNLYKQKQTEIANFRDANDLNFHVDPSSAVTISGRGSGGNTFDAKAAAREQSRIMEQWAQTVAGFVGKANDEITQADIDSMDAGLQRELAQLDYNTAQKKKAWEDALTELAQQAKDAEHDRYMENEGATEEGWEASGKGQMSLDDYKAALLSQYPEIAGAYNTIIAMIEAEGYDQRLALQQQYNDELINQYGTTAQKIEVLKRQWEEKIAQIPPEFQEAARQQMEAEIAAMQTEDFKKNMNWEEVFGNLEAVSTTALNRVKQQLQDLIKSQKNLSPEAIREYVSAIEKINKQLTSRNPFSQLRSNFADLKDANQKLTEAQLAYNAALATGNAEEIANASATLESAKAAKTKALAQLTEGLQSAVKKSQEIMGAVNSVTGMLGTMGVEMPAELSGFFDGMGTTLEGLSEINMSNPISIVTGGAKAIGGIVSGISSLFNHDAAKEKKIQKLQDQIDALQKSYDKLGDSVDEVYSKDAEKLLQQQNNLLQQQKILIQNQISEEKSKKNSDSDRIKEWEEQLDEINELIEENKEKAIDAIFGEDLQSAIENFADAWAEAWENGEDRVESARDTVKTMMKNMVKESIKAAIQSSAAMEKIRAKLQEFYADDVLSDWEQDYILKMADQLQEELDKQFGWAQSLLEGDASRDGTSRGIAQASQESVDENNARLTTIQGHTYTLVQGLAELNRTSNLILERVAGVERNTSETNTRLESMGKSVDLIKATVDDISVRGIKLKT